MAVNKNHKYGIRSRYKPSKKESRALRQVYERKQQMSEKRQPWETKWEKAKKQYEQYRPSKTLEDWQSDIYIPLTTSIVEAMLSEMVDLNLRPLYLPRETSDQSAATVINHIFNYTWEIGDGDVELYKVIKDSLIYGTGIAQEYYLSTPRKVKELVRFDPEKGIEEYEEREIKDFDDCYMEAVKLEDFYVDERARGFTGPRGARDCIRRYIMHIDDLKSFFKGPIWDQLNNVKYVTPGGDINYYEFYKPPEGMGEEDVEVLWYWNQAEDKLIIVANDVVLRNSPIPYKHKRLPFARAIDILDPHQFYGKGEAELLEGLQEEQNTIRRMLMDRNHLDIDKMFMASSREDLDEEELIVRPHGLITVDDINNIKPVEYRDIPPSVFKGLELMREDAIRVTGYDSRMQGLQKAGSTATEAAILKESSLRRVRAKVFLLGKEFLVNIGRLRLANIQQYYSIPKVEKIVGDKGSREYRERVADAKRQGRLRTVNGQAYEEKFRTIRIENKELERTKDGVVEHAYNGWTFFEADPDSIRGNLDISITSGPILPVSKPLLQQRTEQLAQHPVIIAGQEQGIYDIAKIGDALLRSHDFNPDDFKVQEEPVEEEMPQSILERETELAGVENEQLMKGRKVKPTPYVSSRHTDIHYSLMNSEAFKSLPNESPIVSNVVAHIKGEEDAQAMRGKTVPQEGQPQGQPQQPRGMLGKAMGAIKGLFGGKPKQVEQSRATIPARAVGGEQVQKIV